MHILLPGGERGRLLPELVLSGQSYWSSALGIGRRRLARSVTESLERRVGVFARPAWRGQLPWRCSREDEGFLRTGKWAGRSDVEIQRG